MDNYSYPTSYPESGNSSPRSREIEFENTPSWEEQPAANTKVKFMCSYGGKIHPRPHDNQLSYIGGETKIIVVDRNIKLSGLIAKLLVLCDAADVSFKYQLPGEDLDALISVTNDEDLEHMMHEYDRLSKASSKPARLRMFLFPVAATVDGGGSFGSSEGKSDRERFVDALNSGPTQSSLPSTPPSNSVDFLFGLDKGIPPPLLQVATKVEDPLPDPEISIPPQEDRVIAPSLIQSQIQDLQRMQISGPEQGMYRRRSDENLVGDFPGDYYAPKVQPTTVPAAVSSPPAYWPENQPAGGFYQATAPFPEQQVYMIPPPTGMYHAPMGRPIAGPAGQGYYAVQRTPTGAYRDHLSSVYNVVPPAPAVAPPTLPPQSLPQVAGYPTTAGGVGMVDPAGYPQVAYDSLSGRQVYYTPQGGMMPPQTYQAMAAASGGDMRPAGAFNQEGKVVVKTSQAAV